MAKGTGPAAGPAPVEPGATGSTTRWSNSMVKTGWFPTGMADEDRARQMFVAVTGVASQIVVHRPSTIRRDKVSRVIGRADEATMLAVTRGLTVFLGSA